MSVSSVTSMRILSTTSLICRVGQLGCRFASNLSEPALNLRVPFAPAANRVAPKPGSVDVMHLPYEGLMVPGGGINSVTGKATGAQVVAHGPLKRIQGADATTDGQTTRTHIAIVESIDDLFHKMSAAMSGGGSYGMFSGSASYNRSEVNDFNSQATTVLATSSVVNGVEYFTDGRLEAEAVEVAQNDPERFVARFGDSYVQGLLRGGYYVAKVSILSESKDVQKKLAGSVKASFQGFGKGSGSFSEEVKAYSKFSEIKITFLQRGGVGVDHANLGVDFEALSDKINRFPTVVNSHPVTLTALAVPYISLDNFPDAAANQIDRSFQRNRLEDYARDRGAYLTIRNNLRHVQQNPELYVNPPSQATLARWQQELSAKQGELEKAARICAGSSSECPPISFELPKDFVMPMRVDTLVSPEESAKLGSVWREREGEWNGTWTRVGKSRLFDAVWLKNSEKEKALLEVRITGDVVQVLRTHSHGTRNGHPVIREGECRYFGTLNGRKVEGSYACDWGSHLNWSAVIS